MLKKIKWFKTAVFLLPFQFLQDTPIFAQSQFQTEGDPKNSNGLVYITQYLNGIEAAPSVIVAGNVSYRINVKNLWKLGIRFIKFDLNGDGNWDSDWKKVNAIPAELLNCTYQTINNPSDTVMVSLKGISRNLLQSSIKEIKWRNL